MKPTSSVRLGAITLLLASAGACASGGPEMPEPSAAALAAVNRPYTEADVHFMHGMIAHHAQAVLIAGWAETHGAGEPVRLLAERQVVAQQDEIRLMQTWLADRDEPVPDSTGALPGMDHMQHAGMPGILSPEQLARLDAARRDEFDRLFLTYMIQHHEGALVMVDELFASYGAAQDDMIYKLASDIFADQTTEIERMESMLAELP